MDNKVDNKTINKKVFDIRRPGKAPPDTTSRAGIVTNRAPVRDNTITLIDKKDQELPELPANNSDTSEGIVLPLSHPEQNIIGRKIAMRLIIKSAVIIFVFVLAVIVAMNILIDAEIIDTDIKPIVDIINN